MYSLGIQNQTYNNSIGVIKTGNKESSPVNSGVVVQSPIKQPSFTAASAQAPVIIRTALTTKEEKNKYAALTAKLDKKSRKELSALLKNGRLLDQKSNDKSTTLDNLYRIITQPRAEGLDPVVTLRETITTIANPFVINQQFGDLPQEDIPNLIKKGRINACPSTNLIEKYNAQFDKNSDINEQTINVEHSGACVSASIEFNLAKQMPAEFARFAADLTSPKVRVEKTIKIDNLANNALDAVWLLNAFEVPYEMNDFNEAKLTLAPDKNAIMRARVQSTNKGERILSDAPTDENGKTIPAMERSLVDELMQSTFMNVGSQQTYNSLTDVRKGKFNQNDRGLIEFEKTFTESVVEDKNKISVTYQIVDDNAKLTGYETDFNTMKKHILDSLALGENVIIGYTQIDETNTIVNGHEITIIGARQDKDGKLIFTCNDTDDNNPVSIEYKEDDIIPKIHHAGLPQSVVEKDVHFVDNWKEGLNAYKEAKKAQSGQPAAQT